MRHEHDWKRGPMTDPFGRVPVVCAGCLEMGQMPYEKSRGYPAWTTADYERDAERIERKFG